MDLRYPLGLSAALVLGTGLNLAQSQSLIFSTKTKSSQESAPAAALELSHQLKKTKDQQIPCMLLQRAQWKSAFCQRQYQHILKDVAGIFNISNKQVKAQQSLGGIFGLYQGKQTKEARCYVSCGQRALNEDAPDQYTLFELGSVTETFTATLLAHYLNQGRLQPHEAITPYLPNKSWRDLKNLPVHYALSPSEAAVTFAQLATFSGGLCYSEIPGIDLAQADSEANQAHFVAAINQLDPSTAYCGNTDKLNAASVYALPAYLPTQQRHSNASYGLLAQVLMHVNAYPDVLEADFNSWICHELTTPLKMKRTHACLPQQDCSYTFMPNSRSCDDSLWAKTEFSVGYRVDKEGHYQASAAQPFTPWAGASNLRSNASDLLRFIRANLGISRTEDEAEHALIKAMQRAQEPNDYLPTPAGVKARANLGGQYPLYGKQAYAWVLDRQSQDQVHAALGENDRFRSFIGFNRALGYGLVILLNTGRPEASGLEAPVNKIPSIASLGLKLIAQAKTDAIEEIK